MSDISPEAVSARVALLRSDYAADGAGFDADMLAALAAEIERLTRERDEAWTSAISQLEKANTVVRERNAAREALAKAERLLDWCKMRLREPYRDLFDKYRKNPPEHDQDAPPLVISECDSARKEPTP